MADDFGQTIQGIHNEGDPSVATDQHIAIFGIDDSSDYQYLRLGVNDGLKVDIVSDFPDIDIRDLVHTQDSVALGDGASVLVDVLTGATIDALQVAITDGTDQLAINADGSINVAVTGATDSARVHGSVNLVKDTETTVVTESPGSTESYDFLIVSGEGKCLWRVKVGATSSEVTEMVFWTVPANPTCKVDIPDSIKVDSGETIIVSGENMENAASPASDFTGYATLIKKA